MVTKRDYYEVLGIDRNATDEKIKKAFREMAFKCHPDHNHEPSAGEKFKEVNEAYQVLSDPEKRASYDQFGHAGDNPFGRGFEGFDFGGFGDIFDAFFGETATTRQTPQHGADLHGQLTITLEEAAFGVEKEINLWRTEYCPLCHGTGSPPGSQPSRCPNCNGSGQVRRVQQSIFGRFTNITVCPQCHGEGRIISQPCTGCRGSGKEKHQRSIMVGIPPGIENGNQIRLSGEGDAGLKGAPPGNLYLTVSIAPHECFQRDGADILYELPINFVQAALGAEVEVPTLGGTTRLKVPAGSQTGHVFRLKNKGITHLNGKRCGDQLVTLLVVTPETLTEKQRRLFEELAKTIDPAKKGK